MTQVELGIDIPDGWRWCGLRQVHIGEKYLLNGEWVSWPSAKCSNDVYPVIQRGEITYVVAKSSPTIGNFIVMFEGKHRDCVVKYPTFLVNCMADEELYVCQPNGRPPELPGVSVNGLLPSP